MQSRGARARAHVAGCSAVTEPITLPYRRTCIVVLPTAAAMAALHCKRSMIHGVTIPDVHWLFGQCTPTCGQDTPTRHVTRAASTAARQANQGHRARTLMSASTWLVSHNPVVGST